MFKLPFKSSEYKEIEGIKILNKKGDQYYLHALGSNEDEYGVEILLVLTEDGNDFAEVNINTKGKWEDLEDVIKKYDLHDMKLKIYNLSYSEYHGLD